MRITCLGEFGYEVHIPSGQAVHVYDRVVEAGSEFGPVHAGLRTVGSLRMEKGHLDYGHDLDNPDDPYETWLGFAVDLKKPDGFIGRDALLERKAKGPRQRRMVQVLCRDPAPLMLHAEVIWRDGVRAGYVRAAS